ncbi:MAG: PEP-CTERM sorting domain-containing protein [Planctomycetes bacterium]|nr:PEP-CTERM sorting domain-containing protein [Planctomycetota bacterium]
MMKKMKNSLPYLVVAMFGLAVAPAANAGQFLIDFAGTGPNSAGAAPGWDAINNLVQNIGVPITDINGTDTDVTITAIDDSFNPNNTASPNNTPTYDGFLVPVEAVNDYLFKVVDQGGTTARMRIDNLDPGEYTITVFEGRTSDAAQFGIIWVGDNSGSNEPGSENTGSFAHSSGTVAVNIAAGDVLWYKHLEDGSGGISGMIINPVIPEPSSVVLLALGALAGCGLLRRRQRS